MYKEVVMGGPGSFLMRWKRRMLSGWLPVSKRVASCPSGGFGNRLVNTVYGRYMPQETGCLHRLPHRILVQDVFYGDDTVVGKLFYHRFPYYDKYM